MAAPRSTPAKKARRSMAWLAAIIIGLLGLNLANVLWQDGGWMPKLALDLEGGTQIILAPQLESGQQISGEQLDQAVGIIRQRIDSAGISESEINTQGAQNIVVSIPGEPDRETLDRIESSAKLEFRAVLDMQIGATPQTPGEGTDGETPADGTAEDSAEGEGAADDAEQSPEAVNGSDQPATPAPSSPSTPTPAKGEDLTAAESISLDWLTDDLRAEFAAFDCSMVDASGANVAPVGQPLITCDETGVYKYLLSPVAVSGEEIADASHSMVANQQGISTGQWGVNIEFTAKGTERFATVTETLYSQRSGVQNQFAIVLDGDVISAPTTNAVISNGKPQITGSFTQDTAKTLADKLKFGALPIGFEVFSNETISATLGESQLWSGLIAGAIGLGLVVIYLLFQYRTLGLVTVASLAIATVLTYLVINLLSWREGYRLSLAGVAGIIVAIGIIADSFIVYFERVRDELRDGKMLGSAVESGWRRALRTILASDAVNFLAAAVLFVLAIGNVRGFAFTLGVMTIIDIIIVTLFTHPLMQLLARTKFFGDGHPWSGLNPQALGAVYRGRATFREPVGVSAAKAARSGREAAKRQSIAERKAAEAAASAPKGKDS